MNRYRQLIRVLQLRRVIGRRQHLHVRLLAREFGVSTRTIRRDLAALSAAGERVPFVTLECDITSHM
jgi:predicted DNA-binding transcriptional regulator YafY